MIPMIPILIIDTNEDFEGASIQGLRRLDPERLNRLYQKAASVDRRKELARIQRETVQAAGRGAVEAAKGAKRDFLEIGELGEQIRNLDPTTKRLFDSYLRMGMDRREAYEAATDIGD